MARKITRFAIKKRKDIKSKRKTRRLVNELWRQIENGITPRSWPKKIFIPIPTQELDEQSTEIVLHNGDYHPGGYLARGNVMVKVGLLSAY